MATGSHPPLQSAFTDRQMFLSDRQEQGRRNDSQSVCVFVWGGREGAAKLLSRFKHRWASLIQNLVPLIVGPLLHGLVSLTAGPLTQRKIFSPLIRYFSTR